MKRASSSRQKRVRSTVFRPYSGVSGLLSANFVERARDQAAALAMTMKARQKSEYRSDPPMPPQRTAMTSFTADAIEVGRLRAVDQCGEPYVAISRLEAAAECSTTLLQKADTPDRAFISKLPRLDSYSSHKHNLLTEPSVAKTA